jgi:sec-independent protein translocase protein TatA
MGRIGLPEVLMVLFIVIIVFGANRLPQLGRGIGTAIRNFKSGMKEDASDDKS